MSSLPANAIPIPELDRRRNGPRSPGRPPVYPWDQWLDCEHAYLLERGVDYYCETDSLVASVRRAAKRRGLVPHWDYDRSVTLRDATELTVWATPMEPVEAGPGNNGDSSE